MVKRHVAPFTTKTPATGSSPDLTEVELVNVPYGRKGGAAEFISLIVLQLKKGVRRYYYWRDNRIVLGKDDQRVRLITRLDKLLKGLAAEKISEYEDDPAHLSDHWNTETWSSNPITTYRVGMDAYTVVQPDSTGLVAVAAPDYTLEGDTYSHHNVSMSAVA